MKEFLAMIKILTSKLENLHEENQNLQFEAGNHSYELVRLQDENLDLTNEVRQLKQTKEDLYWYKDQYHASQQAASDRRVNDPIIKAAAEAYMQKEGINLFRSGQKLNAIKGIREATHWGLKESKDYYEQYPYPTATVTKLG